MAPRRRATEPVLLPSLGGGVCEQIEAYCVHGPGDVRGQAVQLTPEMRRFIWSAYEIHPKGHPRAGRRVWRHAVFMRRKGIAKTELAAWLTAVELVGEVRFDGWAADGSPVARPVRSPYIPVAATSEAQNEDTLWGALYACITEGPMVDEFSLDVTVDRIMELDTGGVAKMVAAKAASRDGGKPSFSPRDETHLWFTPELLRANEVFMRGMPKRPLAEAWSLSTTTMYEPGQQSVAEAEHNQAEQQAKGKLPPYTILMDYRGVEEDAHDLDSDEGLRAAVIEASGDALPYTDVDWVMAEFRRGSRSDGVRYWLNGKPRSGGAPIPEHVWQGRYREGALADGDLVALGFDGSLSNDSTALWAVRLVDLQMVRVGVWERPEGHVGDGWQVPRDEVDAAVRRAFLLYDVALMWCDPREWRAEIARWAAEFGEKVVLEQPTNSDTRMVAMTDLFETLVATKQLWHDGDTVLYRHAMNTRKRTTRVRIDEERMGWVPTKDGPNSPRKIDAFVAAILATGAASQAIHDGALDRLTRRVSAYESDGLMVV